MITLTRKNLKNEGKTESKRISIRDKLLVKEVQEMEETLPPTCNVVFPDSNVLSEFYLTITPNESYYKDGMFKFHILVPEEYNMMPPKVRCLTKLFHPNISETGDICLSLLRLNSIDSMGWAPTRKLKDVTWGLNSLFTDELINFEDPLNLEAAEQYSRDKDTFKSKVRSTIIDNNKS